MMLRAVRGRELSARTEMGVCRMDGGKRGYFSSSGADKLNCLQRKLVFSFFPLILVELKALPSPLLSSPHPSLPCLPLPTPALP